jgi:UDP-glucuronate 4-epimerase
MPMLNVLITGAAGFIGSHATAALARAGHAVTACDLWPDDTAQALRRERVRVLLLPLGVVCEGVDVSEAGALAVLAGARRFDLVLHLAAQAGVRRSMDAPMDFVQANLLGFAHVLEFCRHAGVPRLLYASSSSVYGDHAEGAFTETDRTDRPRSFYAATKMANELMARAYAQQYGLRSLGLRFFTVYGPWGRPDMAVLGFARRMRAGEPLPVYGDGQLQRDFTFIDDTVTAVQALVEGGHPAAGAEVVNVGHARPVSVNDLICVLERALGCRAEREAAAAPPGDVTRTCADERHLLSLIETWPQTSLDDGLGRVAAWLDRWSHLL